MASQHGIFLRQLKQGVRYARIRVGWAKGSLADAERELRDRIRELHKWQAPDRRRRKDRQIKKAA